MAELVPLALLAFGFISALKPEWVAVLHRNQKAAGTTDRPGEIEVMDTWIGITRISGIAFAALGLLFTIRSI